MISTIFMSLTEFFLFAYFVGRYIRIKKFELFMVVSIIVQSMIDSFFLQIQYQGMARIGALIFAMLALIYIFQRKVSYNEFYALLFYQGLIILTGNILYVFPPAFRLNRFLFNYFNHTIGLVLQFFITYFLLKYRKYYTTDLALKNWKPLIINETVIVIVICETTVLLSEGNYSYFVYLILLLSSIDFITTKYIIYRIYQMNQTIYQNELDKQKRLSEENKLQTLKNIKNEINTLDHRMYYIVHQSRNLLKHHKVEDAEALLLKYEKDILKYDSIIDTGNSAFDTAVGLMFYELKLGDIDFNNAISISSNPFYNDPQLIAFLKELIDVFSTSTYLNVTILESNDVVSIKFNYKGCNFDRDLVDEMIKKYQEYFHFIYRINESLFSFVFDLEQI